MNADMMVFHNQQFLRTHVVSIDIPEDQISMLLSSILMPINSGLESGLNVQISRLISGGFIEYWLKRFTVEHIVLDSGEDEAQPHQLWVGLMVGTFVIWAIMLAVSGVVFMCEVLMWRSQKCTFGSTN